MYKVEAYLDRCLRSCLSQDIPEEDYEILAVDDQSPDSSAAIAASIAASHPCIRVLRQGHAGLSAARNLGLRNACGRYVWFIDSDDRIEENCLGKILETAEKQDLDILRISAADVRGGKSAVSPSRGPELWQAGHWSMKVGCSSVRLSPYSEKTS